MAVATIRFPVEPEVTVETVLRLPALRRGAPELLAGAERLRSPVRWAHSCEARHITGLLEGGELLLMTGMGLRTSAADQRAFVRELVEHDVAGLVIELGRVFRSLPEPLVAEARRLRLPLVALHQEVRFVEVTEQLHTALLGRRTVAESRVAELQASLLSALLDGAGVEAVLDRLAVAVGNPVVLERTSGEVVFHAAHRSGADDLLGHLKLLREPGTGADGPVGRPTAGRSDTRGGGGARGGPRGHGLGAARRRRARAARRRAVPARRRAGRPARRPGAAAHGGGDRAALARARQLPPRRRHRRGRPRRRGRACARARLRPARTAGGGDRGGMAHRRRRGRTRRGVARPARPPAGVGPAGPRGDAGRRGRRPAARGSGAGEHPCGRRRPRDRDAAGRGGRRRAGRGGVDRGARGAAIGRGDRGPDARGVGHRLARRDGGRRRPAAVGPARQPARDGVRVPTARARARARRGPPRHAAADARGPQRLPLAQGPRRPRPGHPAPVAVRAGRAPRGPARREPRRPADAARPRPGRPRPRGGLTPSGAPVLSST